MFIILNGHTQGPKVHLGSKNTAQHLRKLLLKALVRLILRADV